MNTKQIEYVVTIAEEKNMQRAAEKLFITQSALSQSLLKLEDDLGTPLFVRLSREMIPTEAGLLYIEGGKKILKIKAETYKRISKMNKKKVGLYRIGLSSHESINRFLTATAELRTKYPDADVYAAEDNVKNLLKRLNEHDVQMLIITWNDPTEIPSPYQIIQEEEVVLITCSESLTEKFASPQSVPIGELEQERFVLTPKGTTLRNLTDFAFGKTDYLPNVICELSNVPATIKMIKSQKASAFLPIALCSQYEMNDVRVFHLSPRLIRYQMLVYSKESESDDIILEYARILGDLTDT